MSKDIVSTQDVDTSTIEAVVINGDLSKLNPGQRLQYYQAVCKSIGLNPLTKPFDYLNLSGRLILYPRKDATEQLRKINQVSIDKLDKDTINGVYVVTAYASTPDGRKDISTGAVNIEKLAGDALANALMKAETKAKRRATLSICGLGWLDETEIETITDARPVSVNDQGEIIDIKPTNQESKTKPEQSEQKPSGNGHSAAPLEALVEAGICQNVPAAAGLVNRYAPANIRGDAEKLLAWGKLYRAWRDTQAEPEAAAAHATAGEWPM